MPTREDTRQADHATALRGPSDSRPTTADGPARAPHGRARELAALDRVLDRDEPGVPLIEVRGDPWMGKSALLGALGERARERGWTVAAAAGGSVPEGLPFGVFADALDELLSSVGEQSVSWLSPHHLSWLAGIFPALSWHAPAVALPAGPSERHHVLHAVRGLLGRLGSRNRLLLVLDDMHLADEASVLLVQHLLRHPAPGVVLALAHRPRQNQQSLRILLGEAAAAGRSARLELPPLPDEEMSGLLPRPLPPAQLRSLLHASQGRPGLLRALALSAPWAEGAPGAPHSPADPSMPLLREFRGLSPLGRTVAHAAAVLQEPFDTGLLARAAQAGEDEARAGVDELLRRDILRPGTLRGTFRFRDPLVRRTAHDTAGAAWQLGAHARAAAALRDRAASPARVAWHLGHGALTGQDGDGVRILQEAARTVLWQRPDRAAGWLRAVLGPRPGTGDPRQRLRLATALALSGELAESLALFDGTLARGSVAHPDAELWRARVLRLLGRHGDAADLLEKTAANLAPDACEVRARTTGALLATCLEAGERPRPALVEDAGAVTETDQALQAQLLALRSLASGADGAPDGGPAELVQRAARLADGLGDEPARRSLDTLYWVARAESALGRDTAALGRLERALDLALRHRLRYVVPQLATEAGRILLARGDTAAALLHADHARWAAERIRSGFQADAAGRLRARIDRSGPPGPPHAGPAEDLAGPGPEPGTGQAPQPAPRGRPADPSTGLGRLSEREREISVLVSKGRTNQQIARALALSPKTVETYLARVFKKLTLCSRAQLAALVGMEGGLTG
ncbi:helix-turn-helix transcriptional regulator [Streptomyces cinerochromogenes]|uniref:helix-turn-helix transcriptional regulator n=1 Tax=Streptomyces cinerochromogenes TaxID=66422 RepID=UPI0016713275|nr:LuxR family transcriptional regulator [Streptomyces cinerochromogenes]GGS81836.1 LuxR family transcriptional regulator [Streptomyces cinerochromogenes]